MGGASGGMSDTFIGVCGTTIAWVVRTPETTRGAHRRHNALALEEAMNGESRRRRSGGSVTVVEDRTRQAVRRVLWWSWGSLVVLCGVEAEEEEEEEEEAARTLFSPSCGVAHGGGGFFFFFFFWERGAARVTASSSTSTPFPSASASASASLCPAGVSRVTKERCSCLLLGTFFLVLAFIRMTVVGMVVFRTDDGRFASREACVGRGEATSPAVCCRRFATAVVGEGRVVGGTAVVASPHALEEEEEVKEEEEEAW